MLGDEERTRYDRQMRLDGWGVEAQEALARSRVFVLGAGGSASPAITQLALLGVGRITICDCDHVELSNLNRQFIHSMSGESRIGWRKVESAARTVRAINPHVDVRVHDVRIDDANADELVGDAQVVFDTVDDFSTKFVLNAAAVRKGIPYLTWGHMDIASFAGVFHPPAGPCLHCVFDARKTRPVALLKRAQAAGQMPQTALAVMAPSVCVGGSWAVTEAVKLLVGLGPPAYGRLMLFLMRGRSMARSRAYRRWVYWAGPGLRAAAREQGFPLDEGWRGNLAEELRIGRDPACPRCAHLDADPG